MADVSLAEGQRCEVQQSINGGAEFELHCRCDTDRCNALGPSPAYSELYNGSRLENHVALSLMVNYFLSW